MFVVHVKDPSYGVHSVVETPTDKGCADRRLLVDPNHVAVLLVPVGGQEEDGNGGRNAKRLSDVVHRASPVHEWTDPVEATGTRITSESRFQLSTTPTVPDAILAQRGDASLFIARPAPRRTELAVTTANIAARSGHLAGLRYDTDKFASYFDGQSAGFSAASG